MSSAILTDTTLCTGCDKCVDACVEINHLGEDLHYRWREADGLNENRFCSVVRPVPDCFVRLQCRQCLDPACASACPVGALQKTDAGPVIYDTEICMGCRYCMMACPFGIPRYEWESAVPHIRKCNLCFEAMAKGEIEQPACTAACPEHATVFFRDREEALREARHRIAKNPGKYFEGRIWGEHEVGGTSVLYLSSIDLSSVLWHSFKPLGEEPFPEKTERIMVTVPPTFFGVCAVMAGTYWVINRRRRLMDGEPPEEIEGPPEGGEP
jgi:formate dehydrogenase iron-sulfur subunit